MHLIHISIILVKVDVPLINDMCPDRFLSFKSIGRIEVAVLYVNGRENGMGANNYHE